MAEMYGRITGRKAVVSTTLGVEFGNRYPVGFTDSDRWPMRKASAPRDIGIMPQTNVSPISCPVDYTENLRTRSAAGCDEAQASVCRGDPAQRPTVPSAARRRATKSVPPQR